MSFLRKLLARVWGSRPPKESAEKGPRVGFVLNDGTRVRPPTDGEESHRIAYLAEQLLPSPASPEKPPRPEG